MLSHLLLVLRSGFVDEEPRFDKEHNCYVIKVEKQLDYGRTAGVITVIISDERLLVKTMEWEDIK
jgi:hypothetical protein